MITIRHSVETFFFISLATAITLFVMVQRDTKRNLPVFSASVPEFVSPIPTDTPPGKLISSIMDSPEGSMTLTLESQERQGKTSYSLFVAPKSETERLKLFEKEKDTSQNLEIPFNTWSPDNVYLFLQEATTGSDDYLVFHSSGKSFPNDIPYLSIQGLFKEKAPLFEIEIVTGWAAPNLILVNAKSKEGNKKVSFWFDVPSQTFIQLGTYFK